MKKIFCVIVIVLMCLPIIACKEQNTVIDVKYLPDPEKLYTFPDEHLNCPPITLIRGVNGHFAEQATTVTGKAAYTIREMIKNVKITETKVDALSRSILYNHDWFEIDNLIYRMEKKQTLSLVDTRKGEGVLCEIDEATRQLLSNIISHYPYCTYTGKYENGTINLTKHFDMSENYLVEIKKIEIDSEYNITIKFRAISKIDRDITVALSVDHTSVDCLWNTERIELSLKAGEPQTFELFSSTDPSMFSSHNFQIHSFPECTDSIHISFNLPIDLKETT